MKAVEVHSQEIAAIIMLAWVWLVLYWHLAFEDRGSAPRNNEAEEKEKPGSEPGHSINSHQQK